MILHEIILENVGVFKGLHEILLSPKSPKKPITLIGALNGSGKTTILKALQLVLFGKKTMHLVPKSMNYYEFIKERIINEDNKSSDITRIVLTYTTSEFGEAKHYRLERTWHIKKDQVQEQFEVYLDHKYSPNLSDNWNNEVQKLLPPSIAKLFFYDGEQIEMLADPDQSAASLREGIYSLLGIDVIESLQVDLKKIISERQKTVSKEAKKEIELIESSINKIQKRIKELKDKKANTHEAIDSLVKQKKEADEHFESIDGNTWLRLGEIRKELEELKQEKSVEEHKIQVWIAGPSPLLLASNLIKKLVKQAELESEKNIAESLNKVLKKRDKDLIKMIKKEIPKISKKAEDNIQKFLQTDYKERAQKHSSNNMYLGVSENTEMRLKQLVDGEGLTLKLEGNKLLKASVSLSEQIEAIDNRIQNLDPNSESHQEYLLNNTHLENQLKVLEDTNRELDKQIAQCQQDIINQEKGLEKYGDTLLADEDVSRFINYSNRIKQSLVSFRDLKLKQHIELLESTISDAFKALLRKRSLIDRVKIDPVSFALVIYDAAGRSKEGHKLSAAERQLLSVAMLWGLARASGRVLPIVIDTPLGRLDGDHRPNIVEEYFPEASHQVILLSTDTEIDKPLYKQIKGKLSNEYLLEFSDKTKSSTVSRGYFWS